MNSKEKVLDVERQVRAMIDGQQTDFHCPFCDLITTEGEGILCCDEAADVVTAVLDHIEHLERCEVVEQAMDRFSSGGSRIILN
jgi:hypothetical protein